MALTFATQGRHNAGNLHLRKITITLDNSYPNGGSKPTNGWAITAANVGLGSGGTIVGLIPLNAVIDGYMLEWDQTNGRLHVYQGDNPNAAQAPGVELANTSAVMNNKVVHALVFGTGQHT
jgi:hypothetical protein